MNSRPKCPLPPARGEPRTADAAGPGGERPIRSFVRRAGRLTRGQRRALADLSPRYGVEPERLHDLDRLFGRRAPRCLEIGFGTGDAIVSLAERRPAWDFLGIEVHDPGIGRLYTRLRAMDLHNVRVVRADAVEVLRHGLPAASLSLVLLYFPDPWPKRRHHKRRIVRSAFVSLVASRLAAGGEFRLATDWEDYAEQMLDRLGADPDLMNLSRTGGFVPRPPERPMTRFERRGLRRGHRVRDLAYAKVGRPRPPEPSPDKESP